MPRAVRASGNGPLERMENGPQPRSVGGVVAAGLLPGHPDKISVAGLLLGLTLSLSAAGCGDPLGPGNMLRLDAVIWTYYDCSIPAPPPPRDSTELPPPVGVPSYDCGARRDTVELSRYEVHGDLRTTHQQSASDHPDAVVQTVYVAEGTVEETLCDPDCRVLFRGVALVDIARTRVICGPASDLRRHGSSAGGWCEGREGETLVTVVVRLRERPWQAFVTLDDVFRSGFADSYVEPWSEIRWWRYVEWSLD